MGFYLPIYHCADRVNITNSKYYITLKLPNFQRHNSADVYIIIYRFSVGFVLEETIKTLYHVMWCLSINHQSIEILMKLETNRNVWQKVIIIQFVN